MPSPTPLDRAAGAIIGSLIGDALAVGPHWYYDLDEQRRDYGDWISDYAPPREGRYHYPLAAGELSQTGQISVLLLESLAATGAYEVDDFTTRFDGLLATLDGTPKGGRYTDQAVRDVYRHRITEGRPWSETGSRDADTADAAIWLPAIAACYATDLQALADAATTHVRLTHRDPFIAGNAITHGLALGVLMQGVPPGDVAKHVVEQMKAGALKLGFPLPEESGPATHFGMPTPLKWAWLAANDPGITIEPAAKVSLFFGLACSQNYLLPAAYYLACRFPTDFESAVLHAVNGGGHNVARASLTGAVSGAMVGLSGIPPRFLDGLKDSARYVELAHRVAEAGAGVGVG